MQWQWPGSKAWPGTAPLPAERGQDNVIYASLVRSRKPQYRSENIILRRKVTRRNDRSRDTSDPLSPAAVWRGILRYQESGRVNGRARNCVIRELDRCYTRRMNR